MRWACSVQISYCQLLLPITVLLLQAETEICFYWKKARLKGKYSYLCTYDTAPCVMFLMCALCSRSLRGQVGGGWALEISCFLGPVREQLKQKPLPLL